MLVDRGLERIEESARVQRRSNQLIVSESMELIGSALSGHAEIDDSSEFGGIVGADHLQLFEIVHILDKIHRSIAWHAIELLDDLRGGLTGKAQGIAAALSLHVRQRQHIRLRKEADARRDYR